MSSANIPPGATHESDRYWYRIPGRGCAYEWWDKQGGSQGCAANGTPTEIYRPLWAAPGPGPYFIYSSLPLREFQSIEDAEKAAEQAARDNPGRKFYIAQCAGTVQTETIVKKERFNG